MPNPQRNKGSNWERQVAQWLTEQLQEPFSRAPGSGAYVAGANRVRRQQLHESTVRVFKGDIVPGPSYAGMNIECKSYADFAFHQLLQGDTVRQLDQWIQQCLSAADPGDFSILFLKFNRQGTWICCQHKEIFQLPAQAVKYDAGHAGAWIFCAMHNFFQLNQHLLKQICNRDPLKTTCQDSQHIP